MIPFEPLWEQYKRIIKPNGAIALFGSQPFTSALVMSNPKWFKYEWIWEKPIASNFVHANYQPLKAHENICIFSQAAAGQGTKNPMKYHPILTEGIPYFCGLVKGERLGLSGGMKGAIINNESGLRKPRSVLKLSNANRSKTTHPTQKPVSLIEYLLKTYSLEGELIVDNTAGSGTLAIACINTNRRYICIEKDPDYFEVMRNRIETHDPNTLATPKKTRKPKAITEGQLALFG